MSNRMHIHDKEKTVKFVEVNPEKRIAKVFFTDYTFVMVEDVDIKVVEKENEEV